MAGDTLSEFTRKLEVSSAQAAHIVGPNPIRGIGGQLARRIELAYDKPAGWLDSDNISVIGRVACDATAAVAIKLYDSQVRPIDWTPVDDDCVAWAVAFSETAKLPSFDRTWLHNAADAKHRYTTEELRYLNSRKLACT